MKLLAVCLAIGAAAALAVGPPLLTRYVATQNLDRFTDARGDPVLFRRIMQQVSPEAFATFVKGQPQSPGSAVLSRRLADGESRSLRLDYNFGVSKGDLRDLPEGMAREYGLQALKDGVASGPVLMVAATTRDAAFDAARLLGAFLTDSALRTQLTDQSKIWSIDGAKEIIGQQGEILEAQSKIESLDRRLSAMTPLRDHDQASAAAAGSAPTDPTIQVQVKGARYLTATQQIKALEAEKIDLEEQRQLLRLAFERAQINKRIGDALLPLAQQPGRAVDALRSILQAFGVEQARVKSETAQTPLNAQRALIDIDKFLTAEKARYMDLAADPPSVRAEEPSVSLLGLAGLLGGLALYFGLHLLQAQAARGNPRSGALGDAGAGAAPAGAGSPRSAKIAAE